MYYSFKAYTLILEFLVVNGIDLPISLNRSTLYRWRVADSVPADTFRLFYYYACRVIDNNNMDIDLLDMLDVCGFTTEGLL